METDETMETDDNDKIYSVHAVGEQLGFKINSGPYEATVCTIEFGEVFDDDGILEFNVNYIALPEHLGKKIIDDPMFNETIQFIINEIVNDAFQYAIDNNSEEPDSQS